MTKSMLTAIIALTAGMGVLATTSMFPDADHGESDIQVKTESPNDNGGLVDLATSNPSEASSPKTLSSNHPAEDVKIPSTYQPHTASKQDDTYSRSDQESGQPNRVHTDQRPNYEANFETMSNAALVAFLESKAITDPKRHFTQLQSVTTQPLVDVFSGVFKGYLDPIGDHFSDIYPPSDQYQMAVRLNGQVSKNSNLEGQHDIYLFDMTGHQISHTSSKGTLQEIKTNKHQGANLFFTDNAEKNEDYIQMFSSDTDAVIIGNWYARHQGTYKVVATFTLERQD